MDEIRVVNNGLSKQYLKGYCRFPEDHTGNQLLLTDKALTIMNQTLHPVDAVVLIEYIYNENQIVGERSSDPIFFQ